MLVDWVEDEHQATGARQPLKCSVCEGNETQKAVLAQRGYTQGKLSTLFRQRLLSAPSPPPVLPSGYLIHEVRTLSADLLAERTAVENQVFGSKVTLEFLLALQQAPLYRPNLDLLITAPSGHIAAFCTTWLDTYHRVGYVEPIGTVPAYRRLGLGKALLVESFRRLQDLGAEVAYLGHSAGNQAGNQLYDSVGIGVFDREFWWSKDFK
jgi:ribosomal protein S18 acetylase RimI-like enzyme